MDADDTAGLGDRPAVLSSAVTRRVLHRVRRRTTWSCGRPAASPRVRTDCVGCPTCGCVR